MGDRPSDDELRSAGLVASDDPHAEARLELLGWLAAQGFTVEELRAAAATGDLAALAGDSFHRAGVVLTTVDMAARTGIDVARLDEVRRAAGLLPAPHDVPLYTEADVEAFELLVGGAELFSWSELVQFVRVVGSSMARIADAGNTLFLHDVEHPLRRAGGSQLDLAARSVQALRQATSLTSVLSMYLRQHLDQSVTRSRQAYAHTEGLAMTVPLGVGFVDLVGFTPRAASMEPVELAHLVSRFEATANDTVIDHGGRLVKLIGDEVMFVAVEAATACDIAVALLTTFGSDPALTPRGGLAYGDVLARSGDYFGPTVNLAARLAEQAVPGEVLATPAVAEAAVGIRAAPAGRRLLKGFVEPVDVVSITAA